MTINRYLLLTAILALHPLSMVAGTTGLSGKVMTPADVKLNKNNSLFKQHQSASCPFCDVILIDSGVPTLTNIPLGNFPHCTPPTRWDIKTNSCVFRTK